MPFVSENELLEHARKKGYAVPAFFPFNFEFIAPIVEAAEEEHAPVILMQGPEFVKSFGERVFTQAMLTAAHYAKVPVTLSVDHAFVTDEHAIPNATRDLALGWNSVMLDGSLLPYEQNLAMTKELSVIAHNAGGACVGALGEVRRFFPQAQNYAGAFEESFVVPPEIMTDPDQAAEFVAETKVDTLAVSVGQYVRSLWDGEKPPFKRTGRLDFARLDAILERTGGVNMALHGSSHVVEEDLRECVKHGVNYIKVASEQALVWSNEVRKLVTEDLNVMFPEDIQKPALAAVKESVRRYIRLFNASNQV